VALRLDYITDRLGGELHGEPAQIIESLAPLEFAGPGQISFLSHPKFRSLLEGSRAACVIVGPDMTQAALVRGACIIADQPYLYYARLTQLWKREHSPPQGPRIHPSAVVDPHAHVDSTAQVGALCVIERGAVVGAGTVIRARVSIGENCRIGERCVIHSGAVIGADGFGFAPDQGRWEKIEQLGAVRIGNDVEIGANTCIDRGALQDTIIEDGVKLDNLIQIGHNVRIGAHTAMAGCVGVAGSTSIGAHCTVGGAGMILGHLTLVDGVHVSAASVVTRSILQPGQYTGFFPIDENGSWEKNAATLRHLHALRERIKALEKHFRQTQKANTP